MDVVLFGPDRRHIHGDDGLEGSQYMSGIVEHLGFGSLDVQEVEDQTFGVLVCRQEATAAVSAIAGDFELGHG